MGSNPQSQGLSVSFELARAPHTESGMGNYLDRESFSGSEIGNTSLDGLVSGP